MSVSNSETSLLNRTAKAMATNNLRILKKTMMSPEKFRETDYKEKACFSYNYQKYGSFDNWEIALGVLNNLPINENICNELILSSSMVKPYFDVEYLKEDYPELDPDAVRLEIKNCLIDIFKKEYKFDLKSSDITFARSHRKKKDSDNFKYSYHIVISTHPSVVYLNANYASYLANKLRETVSFDPSIIDNSVYKKTQNYRLVGHCKSGDYVPFSIDPDVNIFDTLVTHIDTNYIVLKGIEQEDTMYTQIKNIKRNIDLRITESSDKTKYITEMVKKYHPTAFLVKIDHSSGFFTFNYKDRSEPCFSNTCDEIIHDQIGFYAYEWKEEIRIGCYSGRCRHDDNGKCVNHPIGPAFKRVKTEFEKVDHTNTFEDLDGGNNFIMDCIINDAMGISNLFERMYLEPKRIKWVTEGGTKGKIYFWDGNIWKEDDYQFVERLLVQTTVKVIRKAVRDWQNDTEIRSEETDGRVEYANKIINKLNSGTILTSTMKFVRPLTHDPEFSKIKDIHPGLISCKNGLVDLSTGEMRKSVPEDNITKYIDVEYDPDADSSDFEKFLRQITSNKAGEVEDIYNYLKWCIGYAMQGNPRNKMFIILYGPHGYNGKSLLMNTISEVLEYYAVTMDKNVVLEGPKKTSGSHSTEICRLENCRFGILSDTNEDAIIDDGQMKQLTGVTDKLSVREIYGKQKEFTPVFVPFISTNHPIQINLSDRAMYERLVLIPFVLSFVDNPKKNYEKKNDPSLAEKFKKNKRGVLKWLVDAAVYYNEQQQMKVPSAIIKAKEQYNKQVNSYLNFIDKTYDRIEGETVKVSDLLQAYKEYLRENGMKFISKNAEREFDKNLKFDTSKYPKVYLDLKLKSDEDEIADELDR